MSQLDFVKGFVNSIGLVYARALIKRQYDRQTFEGINERPVEYAFLFRHLARICPTSVLDVGTGMTALPALMRTCGFLVTSIDNISDYWPSGMVNRHYHVINEDITKITISKRFDFVVCISTLEHIENHAAAVQSMFSILNTGGHLVLSFPYCERTYVRNAYELPESSVTEQFPFITQVFSRNELSAWVDANGGEIVEQEYWRFFSGDYWTCGDSICPPVQVSKEDAHQISCVLLRKR